MDGKEKKFHFWKTTLKEAKYVVAPMVEQSELAWRLLSRRHGAQLCYTPMLHAAVFNRDPAYRAEALASCEEDRPLIVQFCANDPDVLLQAARLAEHHCDAIDLNLGCPQMIAKRGHYGAFLQDEWSLIQSMIKKCAQNLIVPVTAKIRIFEDVGKTVQYALMLQEAGCQLLAVHGRTRAQKGPMSGLASWPHIKAVVEALDIPVFANGNIQYRSDVDRCIKETGVQGVMIAEGNLHNPYLFDGKSPDAWNVAEEYLNIVEQYPCQHSCVRGHLFKLCHHCLEKHPLLRQTLGECHSMEEFRDFVENLKAATQADVASYPKCIGSYGHLPYWQCQPYVRPPPRDVNIPRAAKPHSRLDRLEALKRVIKADAEFSIKKLKKLTRNPRKNFTPADERFPKCKCKNPRGLKCAYSMCRQCCMKHVISENTECPGHGFKPRKHNKGYPVFQGNNGQKAEVSQDENLLDKNETVNNN